MEQQRHMFNRNEDITKYNKIKLGKTPKCQQMPKHRKYDTVTVRRTKIEMKSSCNKVFKKNKTKIQKKWRLQQPEKKNKYITSTKLKFQSKPSHHPNSRLQLKSRLENNLSSKMDMSRHQSKNNK